VPRQGRRCRSPFHRAGEGALPERAPERLCRKTVAAKHVAFKEGASEEGAVEQVETRDGRDGAGGGGIGSRGAGGSRGCVCEELCLIWQCCMVPPIGPSQLCPIWQLARSHL
jgi:hypothetical protein